MASDEELLEAWRGGDAAAGSELFERHFDLLYGFFRNKAPESVDDLVQKAMLACVEGRDRIRGAFAGYLIGVARRLLYREYDRRRIDAARIDYGVTSAHALSPSPSSVMAGRAEQVLLHAALRRIPLDNQVVLELRFFQGMTGPQLADVLELPEGTVRNRLRRGLEHLRRQLTVLEADPEARRATEVEIERWAAELAAEPAAVGDDGG